MNSIYGIYEIDCEGVDLLLVKIFQNNLINVNFSL